MPFSNASDYWQKAIYFFTGYDAPHIDKLFSEWVGNDDIPLMKVEITKQKHVTYVDADDLQWRVDNAGRNVTNTDFVIPFYKTGNEEESGEEASGDTITYYKARFTLLGNHNGKDRPSGGVYEGGEHKARYDNDFKKSDEGTTWDTGPHTQYSYGTGRALEAVLDNEGGTRGFEWNGIDVPAERVVDLASFGRAADAFDRVAQFYVDRQAELAEWHKRVGMQENKAWKGTAAGVFWDLIHKLNKRYEDYAEDLRNGAMFSVPGDAIRIAGDEFRKAARKLQQEWAAWEARDGNPLSFLSDLLSEIVDHVWDTNISKIRYEVHTVARGGTRTTYHATDHFRQDAIDKKGHNYGPLSSLETWKAVGAAAIERWKDSVKENLIDNADIALKTVHDAWSPSVFDVGTVKTSSGDSLSQDYEKDKADKEKEEAEEKEEKYRKEQEEKEEKYRKEQEEKEKKAKAEADGYRKEQEEKEEKYRKEQEDKEKKAEAEADRKEKDQEKKQAEAEAKQEKYLKEQEAKQAAAKEGQGQKEKEAEQEQAAKEKEQEQKQAQAEKEQEQKQKEQEAKQEQKEQEAKQEQEQAKKEAEAKQAEQEKKQAQAEKEQGQKQAEAEKEQAQKEKEAEAKQAEQQKKQEEYQRQQQQVQLGQVAQQKAEQDRAKKKQEQEQQEQEQKQAQAEKEQEQKQKEQEAKQEQKEKEAEQEQEQAKKEAEAKQAEQEKKQEQEQREAKQEQEQKEKEAEAKQAEQEQKQEQYQKEQEQKQAQAEQEQEQKEKEAEQEQEQAKKEAEAKQAEQEKKQEQEQREAEKEQEQAKKEAEADQREQRKKQEEYQQRQQQYQEEQQQRQEQQQAEQQKKQEEYQQRQQEYQDKQYQQQEQQQQRQYQQEQQRYQQEQQLEQQRYQQEQQQYQQQQEHNQQQQEQYQKQQDQALNRIGGALNGDNLPPLSHDPITGPVNGDDSLHNPGGSESHIDSHGRVVTQYPDGHTTTIDADTQTSSITTPDGHTRSGPLNVDNVLNNPDGSRSHIDPQGQVVTEYPDGSKSTIDPHTGATSITDPDGKSITGHLNGSGNSHPDFQHQTPGSNFGNIGGNGGGGNSHSLYDPSSYEEELWDKDPYQSPGDQNGNGNNQAAANLGNQNQPGAPGGGGMPLNPGTMPGRGGGGAGGGEGGPTERVRNVIDSDDVVSNRRAAPRPGRPGGGLLDERENVITSGGTPFMPPMGGAGGAGAPGQVATQTDDRERESWVPEDEDVWGSDEGGSPAVIGR